MSNSTVIPVAPITSPIIFDSSFFNSDVFRMIPDNPGACSANKFKPKYPWAYEGFIRAAVNTWKPNDIDLSLDVVFWFDNIMSNKSRARILDALGLLVATDNYVSANVVFSVYQNVVVSECKQFLLRETFDDDNHIKAYSQIVESLQLDESLLIDRYYEFDTAQQKDDFIRSGLRHLDSSSFGFDENKLDGSFIKGLVMFYCVVNGVFVDSVFQSQIDVMKKESVKMPGFAKIFQKIYADKKLHREFGINLINAVKEENLVAWSTRLQIELVGMLVKALELELAHRVKMESDLSDDEIMELRYCLEVRVDWYSERLGLPKIFQHAAAEPIVVESLEDYLVGV